MHLFWKNESMNRTVLIFEGYEHEIITIKHYIACVEVFFSLSEQTFLTSINIYLGRIFIL